MAFATAILPRSPRRRGGRLAARPAWRPTAAGGTTAAATSRATWIASGRWPSAPTDRRDAAARPSRRRRKARLSGGRRRARRCWLGIRSPRSGPATIRPPPPAGVTLKTEETQRAALRDAAAGAREPGDASLAAPSIGSGRAWHSSNTRIVQWAQMPRSSRSKMVAIAMRLSGKMWSRRARRESRCAPTAPSPAAAAGGSRGRRPWRGARAARRATTRRRRGR